MSAARNVARLTRDGMQRARFRAWAARLDVELRRRGARLVLDAPHGLVFDSAPKVKVVMKGAGGGTFTLRVGSGVTLGSGTVIEVWTGRDNALELGDDAYAENGVIFHLRGGRIVAGPRTNLRDYAMLKTKGDLNLGAEVSLGAMSVLHCTERLELGDYVCTGERVTMIDSEKRHDGSDAHFLRQGLRVAPVHVERNVFVAANAVITSGTRVGRNSVVGAGAVLTGGSYPGSSLIVGSPARAVRRLGDDEAGGSAEVRAQAAEISSR
jgi:carbonic anhydrase/acetyltransferase-like protein (isoleucine patch superfamily)